jgi:hypothetical protein
MRRIHTEIPGRRTSSRHRHGVQAGSMPPDVRVRER